MEVESRLLVLVTSGSRGVWEAVIEVSHVITDNWRSLGLLQGLSLLRAMAHATIEAKSCSLRWLAVIRCFVCLPPQRACLLRFTL